MYKRVVILHFVLARILFHFLQDDTLFVWMHIFIQSFIWFEYFNEYDTLKNYMYNFDVIFKLFFNLFWLILIVSS